MTRVHIPAKSIASETGDAKMPIRHGTWYIREKRINERSLSVVSPGVQEVIEIEPRSTGEQIHASACHVQIHKRVERIPELHREQRAPLANPARADTHS